MDWNLTDICKKTGFSKKQVTEWAKVGILPGPLRVENKGRGIGKIAFYPEETLDRLLVLMKFPVSSLTKKSTIGVPGLGFVLFLFGYNDEGLRNVVRLFIKQSTRGLLKQYRNVESNVIDSIKQTNQDDYFPLPDSFIKPLILRIFDGYSKKQLQAEELLSNESSDSAYDELFDAGLSLMNKIIPDKKTAEELAGFFPDEFRQQTLGFSPIKEIPKQVDVVTDTDFVLLQSYYQFLFGLKLSLGMPKEMIVSELTKANELSTFAVMGFYAYKMFNKPVKQRPGLKESFHDIPKKIKAVSEETAAIRKTEHAKRKRTKSIKSGS